MEWTQTKLFQVSLRIRGLLAMKFEEHLANTSRCQDAARSKTLYQGPFSSLDIYSQHVDEGVVVPLHERLQSAYLVVVATVRVLTSAGVSVTRPNSKLLKGDRTWWRWLWIGIEGIDSAARVGKSKSKTPSRANAKLIRDTLTGRAEARRIRANGGIGPIV